MKLHGVCSMDGVLEAVYFTSGNVIDSKVVEKITENMKIAKYIACALMLVAAVACQKHQIIYDTTKIADLGKTAEFQLHFLAIDRLILKMRSEIRTGFDVSGFEGERDFA